MVVDDIQQKSQEEHKGGLDEILQFGDGLLEAKMEYFRKFVNDLALALAEYMFNGMVKAPRVSVNENGEIYMYLDGVSFSQRPTLRSIEENPYIGEVVGVVYDFGGVVFIKDDKLKLELVRRRVLEEEIYGYGVVGVIEMEKDEYERQKRGLYYLRKLSKMDKMIPLAILLLENELYAKGVGERKRIDMEYNMLTGELKIKVCGDDIIKGPKGIENTYTNMLYSSILDYQDLTGRKCIELEGKEERVGIWLNTKYIIEKDIIEHEKPITEKYIIEHKPHFLEKEKIPAVLDRMLSEETLKRIYEL
ncbi:MAG: hypothetical protein RXQ77_03050 [Candidatus Nanopusillus sp.]